MEIVVSAAGSLMLMGEHAVLRNELAVVCAIDQRMRVTLRPISSKIISIDSALGQYQCFIDQIEAKAPFQFVLTAIKRFEDRLKNGFVLEIAADFSDKIGFGSSAAVTVATIAAVYKYCHGTTIEPLELFSLAKSVIVEVQNHGSGADAAACIFGGTIAYRVEPFEITQLKHNPKLISIYSGSKTPTREVIAIVNNNAKAEPIRFAELFKAIDKASENAADAINKNDWQALAQAMNQNQEYMTQMGVNNKPLQMIIDTLQEQDSILAAKISGSGLGDCVIGLLQNADFHYPLTKEQAKLGVIAIPVNVSAKGFAYE